MTFIADIIIIIISLLYITSYELQVYRIRMRNEKIILNVLIYLLILLIWTSYFYKMTFFAFLPCDTSSQAKLNERTNEVEETKQKSQQKWSMKFMLFIFFCRALNGGDTKCRESRRMHWKPGQTDISRHIESSIRHIILLERKSKLPRIKVIF